jgi:UDP-N-acetyl-D-mannosaminuronic acid transferase (WecB/TagA/CpsF family)
MRVHIASSKLMKRLSENSEDFATLSTQADAFYAFFVQLESSKDADKTEATKTVIRQAFLLTVDGVSLSSRLKGIEYPASMVDTRDVREVNKVANY